MYPFPEKISTKFNVGGLRPKLLGVQVCFYCGGMLLVRKQRKKGSQGANVVSFFAFKCPGHFAPVNNLSPFDDNRSILIQQGAYMKEELGTEE